MIEGDRRPQGQGSPAESVNSWPVHEMPERSAGFGSSIVPELSLLSQPSAASQHRPQALPQGDKLVKAITDLMEAGVWAARSGISGLVGVATALGAYSMFAGGSMYLGVACTVATGIAGYLAYACGKAAVISARGHGNGIV